MRAARRLEPAIVITTIVEEGLAGTSDEDVLQFAWDREWLVVSHDVNTMKNTAEERISDGRSVHGLFLAPQNYASRPVAESLVLVWSASGFAEWRDRIIYLPL